MQKILESRIKMKTDFVVKNNYLKEAERLRQTISAKLKKSRQKNISVDNNSNDKAMNEDNLAISRRTVYFKTSRSTTAKSLSVFSSRNLE